MKRCLAAILMLTMLLTACGNAAPVVTEAPETTKVPETTAAPEEPRTRIVPETITTEVFVGDMAIESSIVHSYDERGLLKEIVSYSNGTEVSRTTAETDEHGEVIRQSAVSGENAIVTESDLTYDDAGNLIRRVDTVSENDTVMDVREYTYNPDHTLAKAVFNSHRDAGYTTSNAYEYDAEGCEILEIREDSSGAVTHIETQYDENGRVTGTVTKTPDGDVLMYGETIYQEDGTVKQQTRFPDGTLSPSYTVTTYNAQGNPLTTETYNGEMLAMRMSYTYITVPAFK